MIIAKCVYYRTNQPRGKSFDQCGLANYHLQWRGISWLLVTRDPVCSTGYKLRSRFRSLDRGKIDVQRRRNICTCYVIKLLRFVDRSLIPQRTTLFIKGFKYVAIDSIPWRMIATSHHEIQDVMPSCPGFMLTEYGRDHWVYVQVALRDHTRRPRNRTPPS